MAFHVKIISFKMDLSYSRNVENHFLQKNSIRNSFMALNDKMESPRSLPVGGFGFGFGLGPTGTVQKGKMSSKS